MLCEPGRACPHRLGAQPGRERSMASTAVDPRASMSMPVVGGRAGGRCGRYGAGRSAKPMVHACPPAFCFAGLARVRYPTARGAGAARRKSRAGEPMPALASAISWHPGVGVDLAGGGIRGCSDQTVGRADADGAIARGPAQDLVEFGRRWTRLSTPPTRRCGSRPRA